MKAASDKPRLHHSWVIVSEEGIKATGVPPSNYGISHEISPRERTVRKKIETVAVFGIPIKQETVHPQDVAEEGYVKTVSRLVQKLAIAGASIAVVLGAGSASFAQSLLPVQHPFRIKVGGFFPQDSDVKDAVGDNFIAVGASFDYLKTGVLLPVIYSVYADYTGRSDNGNKLNIYDVGVAARLTLQPPLLKVGYPYAELGVGYYNVDAKSGNNSDTKATFGGKLSLGYQLPVGLFGEVEYMYVNKVNDFHPSGLRANIGYRF